MLLKKALFMILIFSGLIHAQFSKSLEISSAYDDNLYRSPQADKDVLTDIMLDLNYQPLESNLNFNYTADFFLYQDNDLRNFSLHALGLSYTLPFSSDDKHTLSFGSNYTLRFNGTDYNYYDYNQFYAYANLRLDLNFLFVTTGYNYRHRSYSNLSELSNDRHYVFVQLNKSFDTRTTLILEADLGHKSFAGQTTYETITSMGGSGRGRGGRNSSSTMITSSSSESIPSLSQAVLLARLSQSLHDKVGLYIQYRRQFSLTNETNFVNADGYYQDEELFDDPFSYESAGYASQLTWVLPWTMKLQMGGALVVKNYISEQAFISSEDSVGSGGIRNDDRASLYVNFSKVLYLGKPWLESLHFNLHYNYIRSESNSYWYDYHNNIIGGGIQWNF